MRILFDHQIFSFQRYGGISRYFVQLVSQLRRNPSLEAHIFSPLFTNHYLAADTNICSGLAFQVPSFKGSARFCNSLNNLILPFFCSKHRPDIFHHTYYRSVAPVNNQVKQVLTVYDMIHEIYPEYFPAADKTSSFKKYAVSRADHILCISHNTKQDLIRFYNVPEDMVTVAYLGFLSSSSSVITRTQPMYCKPFLLYVGVRSGYKNFSTLLQAFAASTDLNSEYLLVAFGGGKFTQQELAYINHLGLDSSQVIHSSGSDESLSLHYSQASIFIYPSIYEGFGIPPLEAMSFGCPVACSLTSSLPEVVGSAAELFDPFSHSSIQAALFNVLDDSKKRDNLIISGYTRSKSFSWSNCALQTISAYERVLS